MHAMAPAADDIVTKACSRQKFSILGDGGNDMSERNYFYTMVRYWEEEADQVVKRLLNMHICNVANSLEVVLCCPVTVIVKTSK